MSSLMRCAAVAVVLPVLLTAADLSVYRGLRLGMTVADAAQYSRQDPGAVRVVHSRPALIEELEWQPGYDVRHDTQNPDPVSDHVLRFLDGQLFQIVAKYDSGRVEGMTTSDLIEVISRTYGASVSPGGEIAYDSSFGSAATLIARWQDAEHSANLVRSPDGVTYALVLTSTRVDATARVAIAEARRLDRVEAPQRELEQKKQEASAQRLVLEKSRSTNKSNFRP